MEVAAWLVGWVVGWKGGWLGMWYLIPKYFLVNGISYRVGETKNRFTTYRSKEFDICLTVHH
jgi:hypothetical protein